MKKLIFDPTGCLTGRSAPAWSDSIDLKVKERMLNVVASISECSSSEDSDVVVFLSKMMPVKVSELRADDLLSLNREIRRKDPTASELDPFSGEVLMALGRVFSGIVSRRTELYVLTHRHDPLALLNSQQSSDPESDTTFSRINPGSFGIYLVLGPSIVPVDTISAGNVIGIVGISDHVLKTGTLSSTWMSPSLRSMTFQAKPIVRVAVEPVNFFDLNRIERGLKMLYQYDPAVEINIDVSTGQHTMTCLGEIHQEQCVKYLVEKFAKCQVKVSEPIVPLRETILAANNAYKPVLPYPWSDTFSNNLSLGHGRYCYDSNSLAIEFRCMPLSDEILKAFGDNASVKSELFQFTSRKHLNSTMNAVPKSENLAYILSRIDNGEDVSCDDAVLRRLVSIGPVDTDSVNLCILASNFTIELWASKPSIIHADTHPDAVVDITCPQHWQILEQIWSWIHAAIGSGFQLCCSGGPLMSEPMHGVEFIVERVSLSMELFAMESDSFFSLVDAINQKLGYLHQIKLNLQSGQLISDVR